MELKITRIEFEDRGDTLTIEQYTSESTGKVVTTVSTDGFDLEALKEALKVYEGVK